MGYTFLMKIYRHKISKNIISIKQIEMNFTNLKNTYIISYLKG